MAKRAILAMAIAAFAVLFSASALADWSISLEYNKYYNYPYPYPYSTAVYVPGYYYYYEYANYPPAYGYFPYGYSYYYPSWRNLPAGPSYGNVARVIYDPTYPSATGSYASTPRYSAYVTGKSAGSSARLGATYSYYG